MPTIYLYADSRGSRICQPLRAYSDDSFKFRVRYLNGATLYDIWAMIEHDLLTMNIDLIYIFAGVCNMTDRYIRANGELQYWPPFDMDLRFRALEDTMTNIVANFLLLSQGNKLCFLQDPGLDLIKYNRIVHPVPPSMLVMQASLEDNLRILQKKTINLNNRLGVPTPWTLEISHSLRHDIWLPVFDRFSDGLHPTTHQAELYAKKIANFSKRVIFPYIHS